MLPNFNYVRSRSLNEAVEQLASDNAQLLAGGTDLLGCLRDAIFPAENLVSISRLDKLRGVTETADGGLRIGALTTITQVAENPIVKERYRGLAQSASEVASPQLRNQGTIGGNICQNRAAGITAVNSIASAKVAAYATRLEGRINITASSGLTANAASCILRILRRPWSRLKHKLE